MANVTKLDAFREAKMKELTLALLLLLLGCKEPSTHSDNAGHVRAGKPEMYRSRTATEGEQAPTWTSLPEDTIPDGCNQFMRCRAYTVISYDGTWHNEEGNEGLFVLRFKNVLVTAFCSGHPGSCWQFVEAVGKTIWLDDETTDLLYLRQERTPQRGDPVLVVMKRSMKP
jgi:hypothetical protein